MSAAPASDVLLWEQHETVAVVRLNRPDAANAINGELASALEAAVDRAESQMAIRVIILSSTEPKWFCGGADLREIVAGRSVELSTARGGFAGFVDRVRTKPWIAAVEGAASGGGCELALACEMIVASPDASFALPEVRRGLLAAGGGLLRLLGAIPSKLALEAILTGMPLGAERAHNIGLVNRLVPADQVLSTAFALAHAVAAASPAAVTETLRVCGLAIRQSEAGLRDEISGALARMLVHRDSAEGADAFLAKRMPRWQQAKP